MGINTPKNNIVDQNAADQQLIDGFNKNASTIANLTIAAAVTSNQEIVKTLQTRIDARKAVQTTRATWKAAVKAQNDTRATSDTFVARVRQCLLVTLADQPDVLAGFGLTERIKAVVSPEVRVAAAAKARATREARHTLGPKQKAKIKGAVDTTAPAASAPASPPVAPVATGPAVTGPAAATPASPPVPGGHA